MHLEHGNIKLIDPKETSHSLIPDSGIQFLDYLLDLSDCKSLKMRFYDTEEISEVDGGGTQTSQLVHPVKEVVDEDGETFYQSIYESGPTNLELGETYQISPKNALDVFDRQWLPVPYYRLTTVNEVFDNGPTNWARIYLAKPTEAEGAEGHYRLVLAFDTEILTRRSNAPYAGPEENDAKDPNIRFTWISQLAQQMSFANGDWQHQWIKAAFIEGMKLRNPRFSGEQNFSNSGDPWAHYALLLQCLQSALNFPYISLTDTFTGSEDVGGKSKSSKSHLDVDLILDIGNSRTCGILAEHALDDSASNFGKPAVLELRDLSRPDLITVEPFESRIEFYPASFGRSEFGRRSGRPKSRDAFWWPGPIRTGPEAVWLASLATGRDGVSGMSSPKRYVWDNDMRPANWINNRGGLPANENIPPIRTRISSQLKVNGVPAKGSKGLALEVRYSRSAIYMLLVAELISHAVGQMNSVSHRMMRQNSHLPRKLRNIFVTLPSATPAAERNQIRLQIKRAVELVWDSFGWSKASRPEPLLEWDEATCSQLVYLYNELEFRFQRFPLEFFSIMGKEGQEGSGHSLRIASLDIGGGTMDLMVMEHQLFEEIVTPVQLFREGFKQAGDDILKQVIEVLILPPIIKSATLKGIHDLPEAINRVFGGNALDISTVDQVRRSLFVNQVLIPAAIELLKLYESTDLQLNNQPEIFSIGDVINELAVQPDVIKFFEDVVLKNAESDFSVHDVIIRMDPTEVAGVIQSVIGSALDDICDVVRAYDCDLFLLTGRPSTLPAIYDRITANAAVVPNRVVKMSDYRVGGWYAFRSNDGRIKDPKTTASVGALLCHLCQGKYASFVFQSESLQYKSTANYVGKMDQSGQISDADVFKEQMESSDNSEASFSVNMGARLDIGYRQLPIQRWVTSQLYHIYYKDEDTARTVAKPVTLNILRRHIDDQAQNKKLLEEDEYTPETILEEFEIVERVDRRGNLCAESDILSRLQTVRTVDHTEGGYWLDTGILATNDLLSEVPDNA